MNYFSYEKYKDSTKDNSYEITIDGNNSEYCKAIKIDFVNGYLKRIK